MLVVLVHLPVGWNTYLLFNFDIVNFVWKTDVEVERKHCFVNFASLPVL